VDWVEVGGWSYNVGTGWLKMSIYNLSFSVVGRGVLHFSEG